MNHQDHDKRSLDLHRLVAEKMLQNPMILPEAKARLDRWIKMNGCGKYRSAWLDVITQGQEASIKMMTEESQRADAMRQASPFSCALTQEERAVFRKEWKAAHEAKAYHSMI